MINKNLINIKNVKINYKKIENKLLNLIKN